MSITKTLLAGAAGVLLLSGVAAASEPTKLTATEMDQVTAGFWSGTAAQGPWALLGVAAFVSGESFVGGEATATQGSSNVFRSRTTALATQNSSGFVLGAPILLDTDNGPVIVGEAAGVFPFGFVSAAVFPQ